MFSALRKLVRRADWWLHREQREQELREEMEEHRRARGERALPRPAAPLEDARGVWIPLWLAAFAQDLRYGLRQLRQDRRFTLVALSGLAAGIGLSTAVFSLIDAVYWRPLPVKDGDRVARIARLGREEQPSFGFTEAELRHYRESGAAEAIAAAVADDRLAADWTQVNTPRAIAIFVAPGYFTTMGGECLAGRLFADAEPETSVLLTESAWRRRWNSLPDAVGARLRLNGFPFTVAGIVTDRSFAINGTDADVVLPLSAAKLLALDGVDQRLHLLARHHGDLEQFQAALDVAAQRWFAAHPEQRAEAYRPQAIPARLAGGVGRFGNDASHYLLPLAALLVLVVACANLTNLLLARAEARRREMSVRLSLGASRGRVIRQLLTECLLLTVAAGLLGLACANLFVRACLWGMTQVLPVEATVPWLDLSVNATLFGAVLALCAATAFLFGLAPALEATRVDLTGALRSRAGGRMAARLRAVLISVQMAACVILLTLTLTMYRTMSTLDDYLTAVDARPVAEIHLLPSIYGYRPAAAREFLELARRRAAVLPEVASAGLVQNNLLRKLAPPSELEIEGRPQRTPGPGLTGVVSAGALPVFGMRLMSGRDFTEVESRSGAAVTIINEPMAREWWPSRSPLGARIRLWTNGQAGPWREVIGVTAEQGEGSRSHAVFTPFGDETNAWLAVRARGGRTAAMTALRRLVAELDPRIVANIIALQSIVDFARLGPRLFSLGALVVALAALFMASIGLYGVTSYVAARRTKEIGVRMALGARPGDILRMIGRQGARLVAWGLAVGLLLGWMAERVLASQVQIFGAGSPGSYLAVAGFLAVAAMLAMAGPAAGAARVNPVAALREDG